MRLVRSGSLRILDFDTESRPLSYLGSDFTTADLTAMACCWVGTTDVKVWVQTKDDRSRRSMLRSFLNYYDEADIVTGHYIIKHDLPRISGMLVEEGLPPLGSKLVSDTYSHLVGIQGISKSQENLAEMLGLAAPKVHMNTPRWREANRLTKDGVALSVERVKGDVVQHMALRAALLERRLLKSPSRWS